MNCEFQLWYQIPFWVFGVEWKAGLLQHHITVLWRQRSNVQKIKKQNGLLLLLLMLTVQVGYLTTMFIMRAQQTIVTYCHLLNKDCRMWLKNPVQLDNSHFYLETYLWSNIIIWGWCEISDDASCLIFWIFQGMKIKVYVYIDIS